jgi:hypothetical protein
VHPTSSHMAQPTLTLTVLLLFRGLLLRIHHPDQAEHFFHADAHCNWEEEIYLQYLGNISNVHNHESNCHVLHHLSVQSCAVSSTYPVSMVFSSNTIFSERLGTPLSRAENVTLRSILLTSTMQLQRSTLPRTGSVLCCKSTEINLSVGYFGC